ncbi:MAG: radical SAM protein [Deltaproteobacteria bacterium]|nr:radical SAM protein [Deltaproteobacteria bacterium]
MLLIYPPLVKPSEPPVGLARIAGAFVAHGGTCRVLDANLEGLQYLLGRSCSRDDTWSKRAGGRVNDNLISMRSSHAYENRSRYQRCVADLNRVLQVVTESRGLRLTLSDYRDERLSPLSSVDLLDSAENYESNPFFAYFDERLGLIVPEAEPAVIGISLNYLSQALSAFAMAGFIRHRWPAIKIVMGGGLITSWMRRPGWHNPFAGLLDELVAGPGEAKLLQMSGIVQEERSAVPDYTGFALDRYLAPGRILPYSASRGCYWNRCSFCPERAEKNRYTPVHHKTVIDDIHTISDYYDPALIHFTDNAMSPALLHALIDNPPGSDWYGFARVTTQLADIDYCRALKAAGCRMIKLGLESGDREVLERLSKGVIPDLSSNVLRSLKAAGVAVYAYLLFGTPAEDRQAACKTLEFTASHADCIDFLNLAIFNMPLFCDDSADVEVSSFYEGDLSLYTDFKHPAGWGRREIRQFLDRQFVRHPAVAPIIRNDPPVFTSNHAPFFV